MATQPMSGPGYEPDDVSGWAVGGIVFAATVMVVIGGFHLIAGFVGLIDDDFYVVAPHYTFNLDTTAWGWIHLVFGIALIAVGMGLFARATWAGVVAIVLVALSAIANFFFIPYYPVWSIVVLALDIWVLWALTRPGAIRT